MINKNILSIVFLMLFGTATSYKSFGQDIVYTFSKLEGDSLNALDRIFDAANAYEKELRVDSKNSIARYNYACMLSKLYKVDSAFYHLNIALRQSPNYSVLFDPDLINLHDDPRWNDIIKFISQSYERNKTVIFNEYSALLLSMQAEDQAYQNELNISEDKLGKYSSVTLAIWSSKYKYNLQNKKKLKDINMRIGWPAISIVGADAAHAAMMILMHSPLEMQKQYFQIIERYFKEKDVEASDYAILVDKIQIAENKKQLYGTQVFKNDSGIYSVLPIEDDVNLDRRRKAIGLPEINNYLVPYGISYTINKTNHDLNNK